jgi:hypothetical protein
MVSGRHGREGNSRNPQQPCEESDAFIVPTCEKSAKTRVTPVESMEGRDAAKRSHVVETSSWTLGHVLEANVRDGSGRLCSRRHAIPSGVDV